MVKPTLKPEPEKEKKVDDLKDDKLKEWGIIPAAVVIDETEKEKDKKDAEAALADLDNLDTDIDEPRPPIVKCCACFAVFTILLIVTCTIGSFIYFHYGSSEHKWKGWCSVQYNEDENHSGERGGNGYYGHHHGHDGGRSSSEEGGHHNGFRPHPSGPPGGRQCGQDSEVDLDGQYERIERPEEEDCERITILHDYNSNISAYRLWKSEICYITWIDDEILMNPEEFWTNMQDPQFLSQWFNELQLTYRAVFLIPTPLHEQENGKYGEFLDGPKEYLCQGADTYWIEQVSDEFLQHVEQVLTELIALRDQYNQQQQQHPDYIGGEGGELPWDDMQMGGHGDAWPMDDWPMGNPYGGRHGGDGRHGGRHGEHRGEHPGVRRRRDAGRWFDKVAKHQKDVQKKGKEAHECLKTTSNKIKQIGKQDLLDMTVYPACITEKVDKLKNGMKGLPKI